MIGCFEKFQKIFWNISIFPKNGISKRNDLWKGIDRFFITEKIGEKKLSSTQIPSQGVKV